MAISISPNELHQRGGILDELMEKVFDAAVLVSREMQILNISTGGSALSGVPQNEKIGSVLSEVLQVRFRSVMDSGKTLPPQLVQLYGKFSILTIVPVIWEKEVIGALGMVLHRDLGKVKNLFSIVDAKANSELSADEVYGHLSRLSTSISTIDYVGNSIPVKKMLQECGQAAKGKYPVLILGETGTGKELVAGIIHSLSAKTPYAPYVSINCTAIPDTLIESELFGHVKGAFTGAQNSKPGKFELAAGGSIFLDEIGDMATGLQSKLLRVLESKEFERVGGTTMIPLKARVISATNTNIYQRCLEGTFRTDLYYRLNTFEIYVPPLRERLDDIPALTRHFLKLEQLDAEFSDSALSALAEFNWPGNVRQLRNVIIRLAMRNSVITGDDVVAVLKSNSCGVIVTPQPYGQLGHAPIGKDSILDAINRSGQNCAQAARMLGVSRTTFYKWLKRYNIAVRESK